MRKVVVLLLLSANLLACGGESATATSPQAEARLTYLSVTDGLDGQRDVITAQYTDPAVGSVTAGQQPAYCQAVARLEDPYLQSLSSAEFPPEFQVAVRDMVARWSVRIGLLLECGKAAPGAIPPDFDRRFEEASQQLKQSADVLRGLLGLPIER